MRKYILIFIIVTSGCTPTTQIEWHSSTDEIRIAPEPEGLGISSFTKTDIKADQPSIDVGKSYAKQNGVTYRIIAHRNSYVDSQTMRTPWAFEWVNLLIEKNGKDVITKWPNGDWHLHLEYTNPKLRQPIDARFKLWTYWYIPFIDGPTN